MSFTKNQDVADLTTLRNDILAVQSSRGTRNELRNVGQFNTDKTTVSGRSSLNDRRLGLAYISEKINSRSGNQRANDAAALRHVDALLQAYAIYTGT